MMRVPLSKIYRAFPELDPFSDEDCERYVEHVRRARPFQVVHLPVVAAIVGVSVWLIPVGLLIWTEGTRSWTMGGALFTLASIVGASGFGYLLYLGTRDSSLRRVLRYHLAGAKCVSCGYSLLGLPVVDSALTCPECGTRIVLAEYHLTSEDVLARSERTSAREEEAT